MPAKWHKVFYRGTLDSVLVGRRGFEFQAGENLLARFVVWDLSEGNSS